MKWRVVGEGGKCVRGDKGEAIIGRVNRRPLGKEKKSVQWSKKLRGGGGGPWCCIVGESVCGGGSGRDVEEERRKYY